MKGLVLEAEWYPRPTYAVSGWEQRTGKAISGSSVWRNPKLAVRSCPDPQPGPREVVLAVRACGVCGSDMHFYETDEDGYILYPGMTKFPTIVGHEFSGKVVEVGSEVEALRVGNMVTAEEMIWCGRCVPCRNGFPNHCTNLEEIGFTIPGAFANYIAVDEKYCWRIDDIAERFGDEEKAYEIGALTEPTSIAFNAMFERAGGFRPGHHISVFGAGPIGLAAIGLAKAAGAGIIAAFEISPQRLDLARRVGADYAYSPHEVKPSKVLLELSKGEGFNFQVEAAGDPTVTVLEMEQALAINGKIVQIGRSARRTPLYLETLQVRRSQLFGAQGHAGHETFPNVIRLVSAGRLDLSPIITARYGLDDAVEGIAEATERTGGKVLVKPN